MKKLMAVIVSVLMLALSGLACVRGRGAPAPSALWVPEWTDWSDEAAARFDSGETIGDEFVFEIPVSRFRMAESLLGSKPIEPITRDFAASLVGPGYVPDRSKVPYLVRAVYMRNSSLHLRWVGSDLIIINIVMGAPPSEPNRTALVVNLSREPAGLYMIYRFVR